MKLGKPEISVLFAFLSVAAMAAGIWAFISGGDVIPALVAAVILLVAAQLLLFFLLSKPVDEQHNIKAKKKERAVLRSIDKRLAGLEGRINQFANLQKQALQLQPRLVEPAPSLPPEPAPALSPPSSKPSVEPPAIFPPTENSVTGPEYLNDQALSLYLEPVVDTNAMSTAFYRAELALRRSDRSLVRLSQIADKIGDDGYAGVMDMKLFSRLGPVIDRLAARGKLHGIICPVGHDSFANHLFLEELTRLLKRFPQLASVLVIEISQGHLAKLSKDGMAGLAFLAEAGATFCLGGAGLDAPDLASLASLGFRYIDLDYGENVSRYGLSAFGGKGKGAKLARQTEKVGIAIIASDLIRKSQKDSLNHIIKYGRGPVFSPPRLVRSSYDDQTPHAKVA